MIKSAAEVFGRVLRAKEYWLMMFTVLLGYRQQTPWVIVPLAVLLTLWSRAFEREWVEKFREVGALLALAGFWLLSLAQNLMFIGAAFVVGAGVRWVVW